MDYLLHIIIIINIYAILAISLNLLVGYSGLLALNQAGFYGIGAYSTAILSLKLGWPWLSTVFAGIFIASFFAYIVGKASLRFRDDYFVIATFAFQIIIYNIFQNWMGLTDGPLGLPGIPYPRMFYWFINTHTDFVLLSMFFLFISIWLVWKIVNSPFGRVLKSIREDEFFTLSLGKNIGYYKVTVFIVCATLASIAGSIMASYFTFIDPSNFTIDESIFILAIVIIGGAGNIWGSILGAILLIILPELLAFFGMSSGVAANIRQILYGSLLVIFIFWRPQGIIGELSFRKDN